MFLSKSVALLRDGKVACCHCQIDRRVDETKTREIEDEVDYPGGVCLNAGSCS